MRRFLIRPEAVDGARVRFDTAEAHHLGRVVRLRPGALLEATDAAGRLFTVRLEALDAGEAWGTIVGEGAAAPESPCAITLAPALLREERMTWLIQKATELGVARIAPMATVDSPRPFREVLADASRHDAAWLLWEGGGAPLALAAREAGRPRRLLLLVGPEGGFSRAEAGLAEAAGAQLVALGPRILRAESAGIAALAVCQHLFGDLGAAERSVDD